MAKKNKIELLLPAIFLLSLCTMVSAQIRPEVTIGARYLGKAPYLIFDKDFPVAPELGFGVTFDNKWYTGINSLYYEESGIFNEQNLNFKSTLLELEFKRLFYITPLPKFGMHLTAKPGILFWRLFPEDEGDLSNSTSNLISTSISTGMSYILSDKLKISLSPGFSRTINKNRFFNFGDKGVSSFILDMGVSYVF